MRPWYLLAVVGLPRALSWVFPAGLEDGFYTVTLPHPSRNDNDSSEPVIVKRRDPGDHKWNHEWDELPKAPQHDFPGDNPSDGDETRFDEFVEPKHLPLRDRKKHHDLIPVPVSNFYCIFNSPQYLPNDYMTSRDSLARYCRKYLVPAYTVHISVSQNGQVGTFVCNFSKHNQVCSAREYEWVARNWLDVRCGPMRHGQVEVHMWAKWYGRAYPGMSICPGIVNIRENIWKGAPTEDQMREMDDREKERMGLPPAED